MKAILEVARPRVVIAADAALRAAVAALPAEFGADHARDDGHT
jgi:hypothetical protein